MSSTAVWCTKRLQLQAPEMLAALRDIAAAHRPMETDSNRPPRLARVAREAVNVSIRRLGP